MPTNYSVGHKAEEFAVEFLSSKDFKIIDSNWKNKYCEIDIIVEKNKVIYFVEVKYRKNRDNGMGLDYITNKKLKQMMFAAEMWVDNHNYGGEYSLMAIELEGENYQVVNLVEI